MAGKWDELAALRTRVDQLEGEVQQLRAAVAVARPLLEDANRLAGWAAEAHALQDSTSAAVDTIRSLTAAAGVAQPRFNINLNEIYQARTTGYLSIYFTGGRTDQVEILVGDSQPPTASVAESNTRNDLNSYAGTVVRAGEYWLVTAKHAIGGRSTGYRCTFTPLF
jgi:hypothetical protein